MIYERVGRHWRAHGLNTLAATCAAVVGTIAKIIFHICCNKNNEKYTSAINKDKLQHNERKNCCRMYIRGHAGRAVDGGGNNVNHQTFVHSTAICD